MATKGTRMNPYTMSEFNTSVALGNWEGGWTINNFDELVYRTQNLDTCMFYGLSYEPVPEYIYEEMRQNGIWTGGWVQKTYLKYCSTNGTEYDSTLGEANDPCPMGIVDEMLSNGIWRGGWVLQSDDTVTYLRYYQTTLVNGEGCGCGSSGNGNNNGCGCGCGSGSGDSGGCGCDGCGCCGCGEWVDPIDEGLRQPISAGFEDVAGVSLEGVFAKVRISWDQGNTFGLKDLATATVSFIFSNYQYSISSNDTTTDWIGDFELSIGGCFTVGKEDDPNYSKCYQLHGSYVIPQEYHLQTLPKD